MFYSKQKPRACTINHKPRHGTTVLYNAIARRALFGHGLCTWLSDRGAALLLIAKTDQILRLRKKFERSRALQGEYALTVAGLAVASYSA